MEVEANKTKNEIVIYQPDEITKIEVKIDNETVWLNRQQLATLFGRDVKTIGNTSIMHYGKNSTTWQLSQIMRQLPQMVKHIKLNTIISI